MAQNEGPFAKGERLTAVKLNELAVGRQFSVAGDGVVNRSGGRDAIEIHKAEVIYIRLTEKDVSKTPIRYGWKEVDRLAGANATASPTWGNMPDRKGKITDDYAIELNNQNLSVSDNYIYRAERSPATGEWLFFLRKRTGSGAPPNGCTDGYCDLTPTTAEFDLGPAPLPYTGPAGPVYKEFNYETYTKNIITGAVCLLRRTTITNNVFFRFKALSLHPHDLRVIVSAPKATGGGYVEIEDVTAILAPYLPYEGGESWFGNPLPGEACSRRTAVSYSEIVEFSAKTYAAISISSSFCTQKIYLSKGVRVQCKIKVTTVNFDWKKNPVTNIWEEFATTSITYYDYGPNLCSGGVSPLYPATVSSTPIIASTIDLLDSSTSCNQNYIRNYWGDAFFSNFE